MMTKNLLQMLLCLVTLLLLSTACEKKPICQEWVFVDLFNVNDPEKIRIEYGPIHCNGICQDKSPCKPQIQNINIPGDGLIRKEWCGCKEDPNEPLFCHGVRETYRSNNRIIVRFNCRGKCPVEVPGEMCREVHRQTDPPAGVDRRFVAQCECLAP